MLSHNNNLVLKYKNRQRKKIHPPKKQPHTPEKINKLNTKTKYVLWCWKD